MPETTQYNNAAYVGVGKPKATGAIFIAPIGTDLPSWSVLVFWVRLVWECVFCFCWPPFFLVGGGQEGWFL